jgi:hypothetical protein
MATRSASVKAGVKAYEEKKTFRAQREETRGDGKRVLSSS